MFTGAELGSALKKAMKLKKVTQKTVATEFGVAQPSVSEWTQYGRISKEHINKLVAYFGDVVGPDHWGLPKSWGEFGVADEPSETSRSRMSLADEKLVAESLGALAVRVARHMSDLSPSRRKTISHLFASQIAEGPDEDEAKAIDALAPGVDLVACAPDGSTLMVSEAKPVSDWHRTALHLANAYQDDAIRPYLERFVEEVAAFMANEAQHRRQSKRA